MKIIIVGGTGTIGRAVVNELAPRHDIVTVGNSSGDFQVDITSEESIKQLYKNVGEFDALISATGKVHFAEFAEFKYDDYQIGLQNKVMGQINLVLIGRDYINDNGSFTLTSGILNREPIVMGSSAAMVNGAIDGFVKGAAIEMPKGQRINVISPTVIAEAMDVYAPFFRGFEPVPAATAALAYSKSVEGKQTGQVFIV